MSKFYRGVVENNTSPKPNNKVQVRIFGIHTENNEYSSEEFEVIETSDLPWAEVALSTEFGLNSGIGISSTLTQGTWVWLFLEDDDVNKPVIFSVISGTPTSKKSYSDGEGFCDPDGVYPLDERIGENDINEIARGVIKNTVIKTKNDNLDSSPYYTETAQKVSVYPNNSVIESPAGHIIELDSTLNNERVQIIDKHGNYTEMKLNEYITKAVNDRINITIDNLLEHVAGGVKKQVDMDVYNTISGYFKIQADGNLEIINDVKITGNLEVSEKITATDNITSKAEVADSQGNLSSLRDAYDTHKHIGNLGAEVSLPMDTDPKTRASDFTWIKTEKGFK